MNIDWVSLLFSFKGRTNRAKYWLGVLIYVIVGVGLAIVGVLSGSPEFEHLTDVAANAFTFLTGLALATKRLHDRDKPAWWLLLFYGLPVLLGAGAAVALVLPMESGSSLVLSIVVVGVLVAVAIWIWGFIEIGCLRGTPGPNRYGPNLLEVFEASPARTAR